MRFSIIRVRFFEDIQQFCSLFCFSVGAFWVYQVAVIQFHYFPVNRYMRIGEGHFSIFKRFCIVALV